MSKQEHDNVVASLLADMLNMDDEQRRELLDIVHEHYCSDCGRDQGGGRCNCWNDE